MKERERGERESFKSRSPWPLSYHPHLMCGSMSLRYHQYNVSKTTRFMVRVGGTQ